MRRVGKLRPEQLGGGQGEGRIEDSSAQLKMREIVGIADSVCRKKESKLVAIGQELMTLLKMICFACFHPDCAHCSIGEALKLCKKYDYLWSSYV